MGDRCSMCGCKAGEAHAPMCSMGDPVKPRPLARDHAPTIHAADAPSTQALHRAVKTLGV
jgi:hypothetical protein